MKKENYRLDGLPLFRDLSSDETDTFIKNMAARIKTYDRGSRILWAYEKNSNIGVVVRGTAQIITEDRAGNEMIGHKLERGALLGGVSAILSSEYSFASIDALTDTAILWLPYRSLLVAGPKLAHIHGIVMKNFLEAFCIKNVRMMEKIELLSQRSLRERLILYLLQREKQQKSETVRVPGRVQLAKELECNRSSMTREIALMKKEGIVEEGKGTMRLNKEKIN